MATTTITSMESSPGTPPIPIFSISDCPKEILNMIVSHLRPTHYRPIATSCKLLHDAYCYNDTGTAVTTDTTTPRTTSVALVASSIAKTCAYLEEIQGYDIEEQERLKKIYWYHIAEKGDPTTLLWALEKEQLRTFKKRHYETGEIMVWKISSDPMIINRATRGGRIDHLAILIDNFFNFGRNSCRVAARENQLGCLKFLRERNCEWDTSTCTAAVKSGNYEILAWARSHRCHWDRDTHLEAYRRQNQQIMTMILTCGCPLYSDEQLKHIKDLSYLEIWHIKENSFFLRTDY
jgi:hypothetical protein